MGEVLSEGARQVNLTSNCKVLQGFERLSISEKQVKGEDMKKTIVIMTIMTIAILILMFTLSSCRQSEVASYNVSKEADNFNVVRRVAVINTVNGKPLFEAIGRISIDSETEGKLVILVEVAEGKYKKHIIGLNSATTMYVVEDVNGANVDKYAYEMNYNPDHFKVLTFKNID